MTFLEFSRWGRRVAVSFVAVVLFAIPSGACHAVFAQRLEASDNAGLPPGESSAASAKADLPDAPTPREGHAEPGHPLPDTLAAFTPDSAQTQGRRIAPIYHRYIEPSETAQKLTAPQQLVFGLAQSVSPYFLVTVVAAAGYEQAVNGTPNYGSNIRAFGQRLGAAAARNASQSFFSDSVMAPVLHEDSRYYIMGKRRSALTRVVYAATRVVVTRDARDETLLVPNYAEVSGYAEAAILTDAYYPAVNVHVRRTAESFGVSLGGSAISNVVREFFPNVLQIARRQIPE